LGLLLRKERDLGLFDGAMKEIEERGRKRSLLSVHPLSPPILVIEGQEKINFCSNDYLGLAQDPRLVEAACQAARDYGAGSKASCLVGGHYDLHEACEREVAAFKNTEAALILNSGYQANIGLLPILATRGDVIFSDALNHASLIDGCRLSRAKKEVYSHHDLEALEGALKKAAQARKRWIVVEGVYSMEGDVTPLPEILALAEKYEAYVYLDEAHATGVFGKEGRGLVEYFEDQGHSLKTDRLWQMGTFGKALGSFGAYVAGDRGWMDYVVNTCRSFIFTTALPPPVLGAIRKAVEIVPQESERRRRLWQWVKMFQGVSPIIPIIIGSEQATLHIHERLLEEGFFVQGIRPPTVPRGTSRLRLTLSASHTQEHIVAFKKVLERG